MQHSFLSRKIRSRSKALELLEYDTKIQIDVSASPLSGIVKTGLGSSHPSIENHLFSFPKVDSSVDSPIIRWQHV